MAPRPEAGRHDVFPHQSTAYNDDCTVKEIQLDALEHTLDEFSKLLLLKEPPLEETTKEARVIKEEIVQSSTSEDRESISNLFAEEENALDDILNEFMTLVREEAEEEERDDRKSECHLKVDNKESRIRPPVSEEYITSASARSVGGDDENDVGPFTTGLVESHGPLLLVESSKKPLDVIFLEGTEAKNDQYALQSSKSIDSICTMDLPLHSKNEAEESVFFSNFWQCDAMTPLHTLLETNEAAQIKDDDSLSSLRRRYKKETVPQAILNIMLIRREPLEIDFPMLLQQLEEGVNDGSSSAENADKHSSYFSYMYNLVTSTPPLVLTQATTEVMDGPKTSEEGSTANEAIECRKQVNEISVSLTNASTSELLETRQIMQTASVGHEPSDQQFEDRNDCIHTEAHLEHDPNLCTTEEECREEIEITRYDDDHSQEVSRDKPESLVKIPLPTISSPLEHELTKFTQCIIDAPISEDTSTSSTDDNYQQLPYPIFTKFDLDDDDGEIPVDDDAEYFETMETPRVRNCRNHDAKSTAFTSVGSNVWGQWPFFSKYGDPEEMVLQPLHPQQDKPSGFILQQDTDLSTLSGSFSLSEFAASDSPYLMRLLNRNDHSNGEAAADYAWFQTSLDNQERIDASTGDKCDDSHYFDQSWGLEQLEHAYDEFAEDHRNDMIRYSRNKYHRESLNGENTKGGRLESPKNNAAGAFSFEGAFETRDSTLPNDIVIHKEIADGLSFSVSTVSNGSNFCGGNSWGKKRDYPTIPSNNKNIVNKILLENCPSDATEQVSYSSGSLLHKVNSIVDASKGLLNQILVGTE
ncbi:unnamed protein product [Cylindrotheca closterium]|uniref:Uncharacterized protein n=1 Tax=Cylindrotheca closterium TaxID=2856 RepID=A0AAD2CMK4_9STRA|nr:unnamed protein product [Cylindrotheca closterium]